MTLFLNSTLLGIIGIGATELTILLVIFILLPILNSVIFYRIGKKSGYNKGKADAFEKMNLDKSKG